MTVRSPEAFVGEEALLWYAIGTEIDTERRRP